MGRILRLGFVALIVVLNIATGGDNPHRVTGVTGETIELIKQQNFSDHVKECVWKFKNGSQTFQIAEFKNNTFKMVYPQFQNRLELLDGMGLRIKSVTFKDSGTYIAKITLKDHTVHDVSFNVSIYEPVPADNKNGTNGNETHQKNRRRWPLVLPVSFVLLLSAACLICCKKEKMEPKAVTQTHSEEEPKLSVPETGIESEDDKPFLVSKSAVKYQHHVSVHKEIQDDKMAFGDGELPSKFPLQEDSEKP